MASALTRMTTATATNEADHQTMSGCGAAGAIARMARIPSDALSMKIARLKISFRGGWRRWTTSATPAPTSWLTTRAAGGRKNSPRTSGISLSEMVTAWLRMVRWMTATSAIPNRTGYTIHGSGATAS